MKLNAVYPWGVLDRQTGLIVARSAEGFKAADKARALNRTATWTVRGNPSKDGRSVYVRELGDRYTVTQQA